MTSLALPPYIMTSEEGSFARHTIENRKPLIIDKILADFPYTPEIRSALLAFKEELKQGPISLLRENTSDKTLWDHDLQPWSGKGWLEMPWFLAEAYFYRRVLEIVHYFQPGPWMGLNPFRRMKEKEIDGALPVFTQAYETMEGNPVLENFQDHSYKALWGNRADLSNLDAFSEDLSHQSDLIIRNDSESAFHFLREMPGKIYYIFDNVGNEIYLDLAFIDFMLEAGLATAVTCVMKNQPFFVSDAMPNDFFLVLDRLAGSESLKVRNLAERLKHAHQSGRLKIEAPPFFTSSRMYRQFPEALRDQISAHTLTILKGDVNYRRLIGDRHWEPTTPVGRAAGYFPISFMSLRTLKAELIVGLSDELHQDLQTSAEPDWMINGNRGAITFLKI